MGNAHKVNALPPEHHTEACMEVIGRPQQPLFAPRRYVTRDQEAAKVARDERMSARAEREARRAESVEVARSAAKGRIARSQQGIVEKVREASKRIENMPPSSIMALLETKSMPDREAILLAEELGKNRKELLRYFTPVRRSVREEYLQTVASVEVEPAAAEEPVTSDEAPEQPVEVSQKAHARRLGKLLGNKSAS